MVTVVSDPKEPLSWISVKPVSVPRVSRHSVTLALLSAQVNAWVALDNIEPSAGDVIVGGPPLPDAVKAV